MRKYTVETLKKENELFDSYYGINNADVEKVNHLIDMIEKSRSVESIQTFDVVEYTNEYGEYFPKATVTMKEEEDIELCENAGIHLSIYDDELCGSASGGAFSHHKESEFVYKGTAVKTFWTWGNVGARANGGIYFTATVNLWECNNNKEMFSTKTHDKYYLSHRKSDNDYQYEGKKVLDDLEMSDDVPFQYYDNGQSVNIYINKTITYCLNYKTFYDVKFITSIYSKNGLVKEYPFSYDSEICKELERKYEA